MLTNGELFAGISGFGLGFERAGIKTVWRVEIDKDCQRLLRTRYPDDLLLSDVRECGKHNLTYVDIISFGSPCQDLSVAGKRKGLEGARSGLFYEGIRIISELKPHIAIWENVPGALSSHAGRDFAAVLSAFRECGARDIAWRILDARYFGVAQRRRRVFLVADFRGERAAEILFESEGLPRDSAQSGEAGEGFAPIAGTLSANRGGLDRPAGNANELDFCIPTVGALQARDYKGVGSQFVNEGKVIPAKALTSKNQRNDFETENLIAFAWQQGNPTEGKCDRSRIVRAGDYAGSVSGSRVDAIAFQQNQREEVRDLGDTVGAISTEPGMHNQNFVAFGHSGGETLKLNEQANTINGQTGSETSAMIQGVMQGVGVRRLTPTECERLQGFPDGWTDGFADSVRYRMLGNAVCVNVAEWVGGRLAP